MTRPGPAFWRRASQTGVALAMAGVPFANLFGLHGVSGNFLAMDVFGLPLGDPLAAVQVLASAGDITGRVALGAGLALALALVLGPVFCSYACPYGLLSELVHARSRRSGHLMGRLADTAVSAGFRVRAGAVLAGLILLAVFGLPPLLNLLSMPAYYSRLWQHVALGGVLWPVGGAVLMLAAEWRLGKRLWCGFACPQSVLLHLMARLNPWRLRLVHAPERCACAKGQSRCVAACSLGLDPRRPETLPLACNNCGDCRTACLRPGQALRFRLGRPDAQNAVLPGPEAGGLDKRPE